MQIYRFFNDPWSIIYVHLDFNLILNLIVEMFYTLSSEETLAYVLSEFYLK